MINRGLEIIKNVGSIPSNYKVMGTSPRIIPVGYGSTINNTKKVVRDFVYSDMGRNAVKHGYVICDLDLKSCYTSILLGLYPKELKVLQRAVEGPGLWNFIKQ